MPVTLPGHELHLALTGLRKVVPKRTTIPAVAHILFSSHIGGGCTVTGTDLDTTVTYRFQDVHGEITSFNLLAPLDALMRLVKGAQRDRVTLTPIPDSDRLEVLLDGPLGQRRHFLTTLNAEDYPELPDALPTTACGEHLLERLRQVQPFASDDNTRMILNSIRLDVEDAQPKVVATDGRRLCVLGLETLPLDQSVTLPLCKFLLWNKLEGSLSLGATEQHFQVKCGAWTIHGRLIEGQYPNWRQVVPADPGSESFTLDPADMPVFDETVQTLPVTSSQQSECPVLLRENRGVLELSACDDQGQEATRLLPNSKALAGFIVSVNRHKLRQAVTAGFVRWSCPTPMAPLCSRDGQNLHVLMPLRIDAQKQQASTGEADGVEIRIVPGEDKSEQDDHDAASAASGPGENPATTEPENEPRTKETSMSEETKPNLSVMPAQAKDQPSPADPLEELIEKSQTARDQAKELNVTLREIITLARAQKKQDRGIRTELHNARGVLEKLRDIAA